MTDSRLRLPRPRTAATTPTAATPLLWAIIFGDLHDNLGLFSGLRQGSRLVEVHEAFFAYPAAVAAALDWLEQEAADGRETYFCAHLLREQRRVKAAAAPIVCLWVDGDGATVPAGFPQPTVIIESSPGRHHYYWRLTHPIEPERAEQLNKRLAYALGADKGGWDLTQLLRPPGFPNRKYPDTIVEVLRL